MSRDATEQSSYQFEMNAVLEQYLFIQGLECAFIRDRRAK